MVKKRNERILVIGACFIFLSIVLMIITIPGLLNDTHPGANPKAAAIGAFVGIIFHLIFFSGFIISIHTNRRSSNNRKGVYIGFGVLLIIFGLFNISVASSFLPHKDILFVPILIFICSFCDFMAAILTIILFLLKPEEVDSTY